MPIRKERRKFYGAHWRRYRLQLIAERGRQCIKCGREHAMINGSHSDHDPTNPNSVEFRCPSCHARYDAGHRIAIMRRNRARATGQTWLTEEIEYAPLASFEIPARIYDRIRQMNLFQ